MDIEFETAVRTLVCVCMGQDPAKRVTAGLIIAVLSRKFVNIPEEEISRLVTSTIIEEGGVVRQRATDQERFRVPEPAGSMPSVPVRLKSL